VAGGLGFEPGLAESESASAHWWISTFLPNDGEKGFGTSKC
jgi:hypothetical protein